MAYSELVKNFSRIRDYLREFYVYGFRSRNEYTKKSARTYDDERRRLESWLGEYMRFRQNPDGKNVFLSIDSRVTEHNPLYAGWKTCSFTDGDITLHFLLLDILWHPSVQLSLNEITAKLDVYLSGFRQPRFFDASTVRKKLNEYCKAGIMESEKKGRVIYYSRTEPGPLIDREILDFFSEVAPCGVIGSFLLDRPENRDVRGGRFTFKHHYITGAPDSEIIGELFDAMREKRGVVIETANRNNSGRTPHHVIPLRIMSSVQGGRQYLMAYVPGSKRMISFRADRIVTVKPWKPADNFDELREKLSGMKAHLWGVSTQSRSGARMEHVEFTVRYNEREKYIPNRLEREKRCGTVVHMGNNTSRFTADVYDASELVPWIRTFICRITDIHFSNKNLEIQFREDLRGMYALYGLEKGEGDVGGDIQ